MDVDDALPINSRLWLDYTNIHSPAGVTSFYVDSHCTCTIVEQDRPLFVPFTLRCRKKSHDARYYTIMNASGIDVATIGWPNLAAVETTVLNILYIKYII